MSAPNHNSRLTIVSNRLPVGIQCLADDRYEFSPSCGGLVTGLKGLAQNDVTFLWYGWPGTEIRHEQSPHLKKTLMEEFNAVPVLLGQQTAELYYNGFSSISVTSINANSTLCRADSRVQTPPSGRCSITSSTKSPSAPTLSPRTREQMRRLQTPSRWTSRTAIKSGSTTFTLCYCRSCSGSGHAR
jgi:hypothetical protein